MNQINMPTIEHFIRDKELEKRIDRAVLLNYNSTESITLYFDFLDELINNYTNIKDESNLNEVSKYINKNTYRFRINEYNFESHIITFDREHRSGFNNAQLNYLKLASDYLFKLKNLLSDKSLTAKELYRYIEHFIENNKKNINRVKIEELYNKCINNFKQIMYAHESSDNNLYFTLRERDIKRDLVIISNPRKIKLTYNNLLKIFSLVEIEAIFETIEHKPNIDYLYYFDEYKNLIKINTAMGITNFTTNIGRTIFKLEEEAKNNENLNFRNFIEDKTRRLKKINLLMESEEYIISHDIYDIVKLNTSDIKKQIQKLRGIESELREYNIKNTLINAIISLTLMCNFRENYLNLDRYINISISEIKRSNTLYIISKNIKKSEMLSFGEENLTAILASNLRCFFYKYPYVSVECEARVGSGRSDIRIDQGPRTIGLIESKLIKQGSDIEKETRNALDQLYARYSENESVNSLRDVKLYLVIFSYDKDFSAIAKPVKTAIDDYAKRSNLNYENLDSSENRITFAYKEPRNGLGFLDKIRTITIILCNMEIDYQSKSKQRTQKKSYSIGSKN